MIGYNSLFKGIALLLLVTSCSSRLQQKEGVKTGNAVYDQLKYRVEPAPEWTQLFYRKSGWFGGDGIFSIPLDGNDENDGTEETLIIFGDTYVGEVKDNKPLPGNQMVNNSVAYISGLEPDPENIRFHYNGELPGKLKAFFVPNNPKAKEGQYYWLGDGFVNKELDNTLYIFTYHIEMTGPGVFDFIEPDVSVVAIPEGSRPPFEDQRQFISPLHIKHPRLGEGNMGAGILVNTDWAGSSQPDGFIYVYGCIGQDKNLIAARVRPKYFEDFDKWRYWDGNDWVKEENAVIAICNAVSNELSMITLPDGRYLLTFQVLGLSDKVGIRIGESPVGPFSDIQEIWRTPEIDEGLWPYNAKAHPALSKPGELLISYNTITPDFWNDIQKDAHIYRPRFIRLIFE